VQTVISRQWLNFSNGYGKRSLANTGVNGKVAPKNEPARAGGECSSWSVHFYWGDVR
jgi:hypothetical protein